MLLEVLGESPAKGAEWSVASHGASIDVEGEHPDLFERVVVLLVRPDDRPAEWFTPWAEQRLERLGRYMEACNTGRMVKVLARPVSATGVLMRRVGWDPAAPDAELPPTEAVPGVLSDFARDVERYQLHMGDDGLEYVRAIRLHRVPRKSKGSLYVLGLDVLPTAVGLTHDPMPISPVSLVRGVLGEFADHLEQRREGIVTTRSLVRPLEFLRTRGTLRRLVDVVDGLDELCGFVDDASPSLSALRAKLGELGKG